MPKWLKVVLLVGGLTLLAMMAMCGACGFWAVGSAQEMSEKRAELEAEATADAKALDQQGCLDKSLTKAEACADLGPFEGAKCQQYTKMYGAYCLDAAKETAGFCDSLPSGESLMEIARWSVQRCQDLGRAESATCPQVVQVVLEHCGVLYASFGRPPASETLKDGPPEDPDGAPPG